MITPLISKKNLSIIALALALATPGVSLADPLPPSPPGDDPIPPLFCMRITDIERVDINDGTGDNDFAVQFEILNWTGTAASGFNISSTIGTTEVNGTKPTIHGIGIDRDGRGGALGGADIDASGAGITAGAGTFDPIAIHSGRGRGDIPGALNDWSGVTFNATSGLWGEGAAGTSLDPQDLIGARVPGGLRPIDLIPSQTPPYTPGDVDLLGDSSIDGGPGTFAMDDPIPDGTMNQLDGFTMTIQDWDVNEVFSVNWFLIDSEMKNIGSAGIGNNFIGSPMGFGLMNLARIPVGGAFPDPVFAGNTGFIQGANVFYDGVYRVPNPAEFGVELGIGTTGAFADPNDNIFNARVNTTPIPTPIPLVMFVPGLMALLLVRRRRIRAVS